jgi:hypothetical protein
MEGWRIGRMEGWGLMVVRPGGLQSLAAPGVRQNLPDGLNPAFSRNWRWKGLSANELEIAEECCMLHLAGATTCSWSSLKQSHQPDGI